MYSVLYKGQMASYSIRTSRLGSQLLPFSDVNSRPLPLASNWKQDPMWKTILSHLKPPVSRQRSARESHPLQRLGRTNDLTIVSSSLPAAGQLLVGRFHYVSMESYAGVVVGLGAHCLFQFCTGPYVWCPGPCRKGRRPVGNCTITLAASQSHGQSSAVCCFVEVSVGALVESFQWPRVMHTD